MEVSAVESKGPKFGMRHVQASLLFFNMVVIYISRLNVGVALVAMTNAEKTNPNFPEYDWDEKQKSYILSSFYWGYLLTQFLGGHLCRHYGVKLILFVATFGTALSSLVTPFCIPWGGWQIYCAIRIFQGLLQGVVFPCVHQHIAKWSPPLERNRIGAISYTGTDCGNVVAMAITGIIAESPLGWPGISYVSAALTLLWCVPWLIFGANNAPASRYISEAECNYIEKSLQRSENFHDKKIPIPWKAIATSVPFIALVVTRCAQGWGFSILQSQIPSYINGVLDKNIKSNGLYSALPFLTMWACAYIYLIMADVLMKHQCCSLTTIRKSFNTLAYWVPAAAFVGIGFLDKEQATLAFILMAIIGGINAGSSIGSLLNTIDLSANHTGLLMGITNTAGNIFPMLTPIFVGLIVTDETDRTQWQIIFLCSAAVYFVGNLVYVIWGSTKTQPWDAEDFLTKEQTLEKGEKSINKTNLD